MRKDIEYMPDEYKLKPFFHTGHQTYTRRWSKKEEEWLKYLLSKNYTRREIAESMGRSVQSIIDKRKKMRKKDKTFCKKDWNHISRVWFKISPMKKRGEEFYRKKTKKVEFEKNLNEWM